VKLLFPCSGVKCTYSQSTQIEWSYPPSIAVKATAAARSNIQWSRWWKASSSQETSSWLQSSWTRNVPHPSVTGSHSLLENWCEANDSFTRLRYCSWYLSELLYLHRIDHSVYFMWCSYTCAKRCEVVIEITECNNF